MKGKRYSGLTVPLLVTLLLIFLAAIAEAATISGTVTNSSSKSGWVYLSLRSQYGNTGLGTAVQLNSGDSAPYSIIGAYDGSYSVEAFVDTTDTGVHHANDPAASQNVTITANGNVNQNLTITTPGSIASLSTAVTVQMVPTDGGAFVEVNLDSLRDGNGLIIPDRFDFSCTAGSFPATIPANDNAFALLNGLTNGTTLTCTAVPVVNGEADTAHQGSTAPTPIGDCNSLPAVFGACPAGTAHVTGQVAFTGLSLTGRSLYLALVPPGDDGAPIVAAVNTLSNPATFDLYGIPQGAYQAYAILDNDSHTMGPGDVIANDRRAPVVIVDGVEPLVIVPTVTLKAANADVSMTTSHGKNFNFNDEDYNLDIQVETALKQPATVTLKDTEGNVTFTIGRDTNWGGIWFNTPSMPRPVTGSIIGYMDIRYTDNSEDINLPGIVGPVLDDFPVATFPVGDVRLPSNATPMAAWRTPGLLPGYYYSYRSWLNFGNQGDNYFSAQTLTSTFNLGGASLPNDSWSSWSLNLRDLSGNSTYSGTGFVPRSSGPVIADVSPTGGPAGTPVIITGSGFTGATGVSFNGSTANFTFINDGQLTTTVPNGASLGPILVTADGITGASSSFAATTSITGSVTTNGGTGIVGATIKVVGSNPPIIATSGTNGAYILAGIPAGVPFALKFSSGTAGDHPTYNNQTNIYSNSTAIGGFNYSLTNDTDLSPWESVHAGFTAVKNGTKGMLRTRVTENFTNGTNAPLAGATVSVRSWLHPDTDTPYPIIYDDATNNPSLSATSTPAGGRFTVLDIDEGDVITVTASKPGYAFISRAYVAHAGAVSQGRVVGATAPAAINVVNSATPNGDGSYNAPLNLSFSLTPGTVTGGQIYYTTDGRDPQFYGTPISPGANFNLTNNGQNMVRYVYRNIAGAYAAAGQQSFTVVNDFMPPTVYATPPGYETFGSGTFKSAGFPLNVTFTASEPSTVYYTLDNSTPTISSTALTVSTDWGSTTAIPVNAEQTLRFFARDTAGNFSQEQNITFSNTTPVSFSGNVFSSDGTTPLLGATVSMMENPSLSTTTDASGAFTLTDLPQGQDLKLQISYPGKQNSYSVIMNLNTNVSGREYRLYTLAEMQAWGHAAGTGVVRGIVQQTSAGKSPLSGAQVFISNSTGGIYPVLYDNGTGIMPGSDSSTSANGVFYVLGVNPGDILTMTASLNGYSFNSQRFQAQADGVTEGRLNGTANVFTSVTISATAAANGTISPAGDFNVSQGSDLTYTITPDPGFQVAALVVDGLQLPGMTSYTFTNVTENHYINAYFEPAGLTISAAAGPNGSISPAGATAVAPGSSQFYTITPAPGFMVAALVVDGTQIPGATTFTFTDIATDHYINAYFAPADIFISAAAGPNGSISPAGATAVTQGNIQTYTITPDPGFVVAALVVDGAILPGVTTYSFLNVTASHYINAYFAPADIFVSAAAGPNGSISPAGSTAVASGGSQSYTITPAPGFMVAALVVDGTLLPGATTYTFSNVTASHYINAYFSPLPASVTINAAAAPNGSISPAGATTLAGGGNQTYTITPDPGFSVAALVVDGVVLSGSTSYTFTNVSADHYINAYFQ